MDRHSRKGTHVNRIPSIVLLAVLRSEASLRHVDRQPRPGSARAQDSARSAAATSSAASTVLGPNARSKRPSHAIIRHFDAKVSDRPS